MAKRSNPTPQQVAEGARIADMRQAAGFDQTSAAKATDLSRQWISAIETGRADAPAWMILLYKTMIELREERGLDPLKAIALPQIPRHHRARQEHAYNGYKIIPEEGECRSLEPTGIPIRYWSVTEDTPDCRHLPGTGAYRTIQEARQAIDNQSEALQRAVSPA